MGGKFMTEVYLIRHSEKYRNFNNIINDDSFQLFNEKIILSFKPSGTSPLTILSANPSTI